MNNWLKVFSFTLVTFLISLQISILSASDVDVATDVEQEGNEYFIRKDGTSTTTAEIPLAEGLSVPEDKRIVIGAAATPANRAYVGCSSSTHGCVLRGKEGTATDPSAGAVGIYGGGDSASGEAGSAWVRAGDGYLGDGGNAYLWAGQSEEGNAGKAHVWSAQTFSGGIPKLAASTGEVSIATPGVDYVAATPTPILTGTPTPNMPAGFNSNGRLISITPIPAAGYTAVPPVYLTPGGAAGIDYDTNTLTILEATTLAVKTPIPPTPQTIPTIKITSGTFVDGDLSSGVLTITHNTGRTVSCQIYTNGGVLMWPDSIVLTSTSVATVYLVSRGTLTGTWSYVCIG